MGIEDIRSDWPEFLPAKRIKEGIMEIAFELIAIAALVDSVRREKYKSDSSTLTC
jgi:hypothetical protein